MKRRKTIEANISEVRTLIGCEENISSACSEAMFKILDMMELLVARLGMNSQNSSKPPSSDTNRGQSNKGKSKRKAGGQPGRVGSQLQPVSHPDQIEALLIDRRTLPEGDYSELTPESRQVVDINVSIVVTEYQAQVLVDQYGRQYVANFPPGVTRPIQYGSSVKAQSVYQSQFQLIPYERVADYFCHQMGLSVSVGSIVNFNQQAYDALDSFDALVKQKLMESDLINADETGINIGGKRHWLHTASNDKWTYFYPHAKRGKVAMDEIGILPYFAGVLCHDYWTPYYRYDCQHALCNAHHLRELQAAIEDNQPWAEQLKAWLIKLNKRVDQANGQLSDTQYRYYKKQYLKMLEQGNQQCPATTERSGQRGRVKQTKSRNLLNRLQRQVDDVLRFMTASSIPFTNNRGENDIRMTKVQQKISGCFRSLQGALTFCRIRSYLVTCQKHHINPTDALTILFKGGLPDFDNST